MKKPKPTRWQFGIRSRNPPLEAVSCIYRALKKLGAEWVAAEDDEDYSDEYDSDEYSGSEGGGSQSGREDTGVDESPRSKRVRAKSPGGSEYDGDDGSRRKSKRGGGDGDGDDKDKIKPPEDPWVIHCRWRKDGMVPPKVENGTPGHGNISATSSLASTPKDGGSVEGGSSRRASTATGVTEDGTESVYVHMEIQLYKLENNFYLVDFKCGGYERIFDDDDEEYSSGSGSGDEYEYDDGIPEEGYVPEDDDEPPVNPEGEGGEKKVLGVANPDKDGAGAGETGDGQGGSKKKVGFAADGDDAPAAAAGGRSRRGSDAGHLHGDSHHHGHGHGHGHGHHHHNAGGGAGSDDGMSDRGRKPQEDKDVTSPFPFLDMATKLIIQLAEAD